MTLVGPIPELEDHLLGNLGTWRNLRSWDLGFNGCSWHWSWPALTYLWGVEFLVDCIRPFLLAASKVPIS